MSSVNSSKERPPVDVVLLTALPIELEAARRVLELGPEPSGKLPDGMNYWEAEIELRRGESHARLVLACIGAPGNVEAAAATMRLIAEFHPQLVLMVGIAAGSRGRCQLGEVVMARRVVAYEPAAELLDERGARQQLRPEIFPLDEHIQQDVVTYLGAKTELEERLDTGMVRFGLASPADNQSEVVARLSARLTTIASGEKLLRNPEKLEGLRNTLHGEIEVGEMEGAGVAIACRRTTTPFLIVRGISDLGDHTKDDRFHLIASARAALVAVDCLQQAIHLETSDESRLRREYLTQVISNDNLAAPLRMPYGIGAGELRIRLEDVFVMPGLRQAYPDPLPIPLSAGGREKPSSGEKREPARPVRPPAIALLDELRDPRILEGRPRYTIEGQVGSGKSTLLVHLRLVLAQHAARHPSAPIPILIQAGDLSSGELGEAFRRNTPGFANERLLQARDGRYILLVDGLDEVDRRALNKVSSSLQELARRPDVAALVVAGRPRSGIAMHPDSRRLWLEPWSPEQSERFFELWRQHAPEQTPTRGQGHGTGAISSLLTSPLTATFCALMLGRKRRDALQSRAALFRGIVFELFQDWASRRPPDSGAPLGWSAVAEPFQRLALDLLRDGVDAVERWALVERLSCVAGARELEHLEVAQRHYGLMVALPDDRYRFVLRSLAEHLAGEALLRQGDVELLRVAREGWAEEPVRHAIGLAACERKVSRALGLIRALLSGVVKPEEAVRADDVRRLLVAARAAMDLGEEAEPIANELSTALVALVTMETSIWIPRRVAEVIQELSRAGGPCWDALLPQLEGRLRESGAPANWFAGLPSAPWEFWEEALLREDMHVREVAIERLAKWVDLPQTQTLLYTLLWDQAPFVPVGVPIAVRAALLLRKSKRPFALPGLEKHLRLLLKHGGQLCAGAAAIALLPGEAPAPHIVEALRHMAMGYRSPMEVVYALAETEEGRAALEEHWPHWDTHRPLKVTPIPEAPPPTQPRPPLSERIRRRVLWAMAPGFAHQSRATWSQLEPSDSAMVTETVFLEAREHLQVAIELLAEIQRLRLSPEAWSALGQAAANHPSLRRALLDYVERELKGENAPFLDGAALEPLVVAEDDEAARIYADWLPHNPLVIMPQQVSGEIDPRVLRHPTIRPVAERLAVEAWHECVDGYLNKEGQHVNLSSGTMAGVLRALRPTWEHLHEIREGLQRLAQTPGRNGLTAAMLAYANPPHPSFLRESVVRHLTAQWDIPAIDQFDLPFMIRWAMSADLGPSIHAFLEHHSQPGSYAYYTASAALTRISNEPTARELSARIASNWPNHWFNPDRNEKELGQLASAAPRAWHDRLERLLLEQTFWLATQGDAAFKLARVLVPHLRDDQRRRLLRTMGETIGCMELPWTGAVDARADMARPSDRFKELLFDLGLPEEEEP